MLKKIGVAALVGVVGLWLVGVTTLGMKRTNSLATTLFSKCCRSAQMSVPLEVEIERIRAEINQLEPDMDKHISKLAVEKAQVEQLREGIATAKVNLRNQKDKVLAMTRSLESDQQQVVYRGETIPAHVLRSQLNREFNSYKRLEAEIKSREKLLEAREQALAVAEEQLRTMADQRRELEVAVANLETELKTVRLEESRSKFQIDDSRLAHIKESLNEIQGRLREKRIEIDLRNQFGEVQTPVENKTPSTREITSEVRKYFGENQDNVAGNK
jgi:chromosome segregation ATPase